MKFPRQVTQQRNTSRDQTTTRGYYTDRRGDTSSTADTRRENEPTPRLKQARGERERAPRRFNILSRSHSPANEYFIPGHGTNHVSSFNVERIHLTITYSGDMEILMQNIPLERSLHVSTHSSSRAASRRRRDAEEREQDPARK